MNPIRILVVEDEEIVAMDIESRLGALGYAVAGHAASGERAVALAQEIRPNVVLMDIRLRGEMDGIAAARQIRSRFQLPVVFLTAHSEGATLERAKLAEPFGYILKPFEDRELRTVIEMALYKHGAEKQILHVNRLYAVLSEVNQCIVRATEVRALGTDVCDLVVRFGDFPAVWIAEYAPDRTALHLSALTAGERGLQEELRATLPNRMGGMFPADSWLQQTFARLTFETVANSAPELEVLARRHGLCELAAAAIHFHGQPWGVLCIHASEAGFFGEKECSLVAEIALDLGFAIEHIAREAKRQAAEAALQHERDRLRQILDAQFGLVLVLEKDGTVIEVNRTPLALMGLERADVLGRIFWDVGWLESGSVTAVRAAVAAAARGETVREDVVACFLHGMRRHVDAVFSPLRNSADAVVNVVFFGVDITERKQAAEALLAQEKRFRSLIEQSTDVVCLLAADGTLKYVSPAFSSQLGLAVAEWVERSVFDLIWPEGLAAAQELYEAGLAAPGKVIRGQLRLRHADGTSRWWDVAGTNRIADPTINGIVLNCHDITERKQAGERIRQQAALIEATHDAILVWEPDRGIQFMNSAAENLTGWTLARAMTHDLAEVLRPRHELALRAALQAVKTAGSWNGELSLVTGNDTIREVASRWTVVGEGSARAKAVLITGNDITERKQLERQYLRAQRLESVGTLASGVAHDLNNILSPIVIGLEMLSASTKEEETRGVLAMMHESARRGRDTIKQLLIFARGGASQKGPVQPRQVLGEIARLLQQTFPKNIQIHTDFAREPATVLADPSQLHQVLMNLCVNARDAMSDGGVLYLTLAKKTLDASTVAFHPKARPGPYVVFQVADSGVGIPPDVMDRIFDPFFTTKPQGMGTGLGLATVLGIVENHGGFVTVESKVGRGTTFEVYLPSTAPVQAEAAKADPASPLRGDGELVLVVDDEPSILRMTESVLRRSNYDTLVAATASEALQLFEENRGRLRVVLTDIMMPYGDGRQLIAALHEMDPKLLIIAMSGHPTREFQREALSRGAQVFLSKPFSTEQLLASLGELLKRNPA